MTPGFLKPVFKEESTDTPRFPCPKCRQIIALGPDVCKYCGAVINAAEAKALNEVYRKVTDAVAMANTFKMSVPGAVLLTAVSVVSIMTYSRSKLQLVLVEAIVVSAISYAVNWFRKYG